MQTFALKFILIGDIGVGKSQLSRRFAKNQFLEDSKSTVGMEFSTKEIPFEKSLIKAQVNLYYCNIFDFNLCLHCFLTRHCFNVFLNNIFFLILII